MTPDEIREIEPTIETRQTEDGPFQYSPDINQKKFEILREIAAQLAEGNVLTREFRRHNDERSFPRQLMGGVLEIKPGIFGLLCSCGSIHYVEEQELEQIRAQLAEDQKATKQQVMKQ